MELIALLTIFFKNCSVTVNQLIGRLFNLALNSGIVPSDWYIGIIIPLYKNKGSIDDPEKYRGITLLSCLGKLFTSAINLRRRMWYLGQ